MPKARQDFFFGEIDYLTSSTGSFKVPGPDTTPSDQLTDKFKVSLNSYFNIKKYKMDHAYPQLCFLTPLLPL